MSTNPNPPNIDQRIEALTHSVELLSQMHQDNEKRYTKLFEQMASTTERLVQILENHEDRINRLEDKGE